MLFHQKIRLSLTVASASDKQKATDDSICDLSAIRYELIISWIPKQLKGEFQ